MTGDPAADLVAAAEKAGVGRIVRLSSQAVGTRPGSPSHGSLHEFEEALRGSGTAWTVLRPGGFASDSLAWEGSVRAVRAVAAPFADVALPFVDPHDIADVAAAALLEDGHAGRTYVLTGPAPVSPRDRARGDARLHAGAGRGGDAGDPRRAGAGGAAGEPGRRDRAAPPPPVPSPRGPAGTRRPSADLKADRAEKGIKRWIGKNSAMSDIFASPYTKAQGKVTSGSTAGHFLMSNGAGGWGVTSHARYQFRGRRGVIVRIGQIMVSSVLLLLLAGGCGAAGTGETGTGGGGDKAAAGEGGEPKKAKIGTAVKDGTFTFKVTAIKKGPKRIGDQYAGVKAQGKFIFVHVTVKNHGDEAQFFSGEDQKLLAIGKEYSADTEAAIHLGDKAQSLLEEINPGNSVKGIIVYDIPKKVKPTGVELHDSMFSDGVRISLK